MKNKKLIFFTSFAIILFASVVFIFVFFPGIFQKGFTEDEIKKACEGQPYWCEQNMSDECVKYGKCVG